MPIVRMPNGDMVNFPDDMPQEQIKGLIAQKFPELAQKTPLKAPKTAGQNAMDVAKGALYGLVEDPTNVIGAGIATLAQNMGVGPNQTFNENLDVARESALARYGNPESGYFKGGQMAGNVAGAILPSTAALKGIGALAPVASKAPVVGDALSKLATGIGASKGLIGVPASGAIAGGIGSLSTEGDLSGVVPGAIGAGVVGVAGKALSPFFKSAEKAADPLKRMDALRAEAHDLYDQAYQTGAAIKPKFVGTLLDDIYSAITPKTNVDEAFAGANPAVKAIEKLNVFRNKPMPIDELHSLEKNLGALAEENVIGATGKLSAIGNQYKTAQRIVRKTIENMADKDVIGGKKGFELIKQANDKWSRSGRLGKIENISTSAKLTEQPSTSIRNQLRTILSNPNKIKNYTKPEVEAMKKAAEMDITSAGLRLIGSRLPATFAAGGTAFTGFNPAAIAGTAALAGGSALARAGANARQFSKLEELSRLIAGQTPLQSYSAPASVVRAGALSSDKLLELLNQPER